MAALTDLTIAQLAEAMAKKEASAVDVADADRRDLIAQHRARQLAARGKLRERERERDERPRPGQEARDGTRERVGRAAGARVHPGARTDQPAGGAVAWVCDCPG